MTDNSSALVEEAQKIGGTIVSNGDPKIIDFDFDPLVDMETSRVAQLVFNAYVESSPEYNEAAEGAPPRPQWRQEFLDAEGNNNDDGEPRRYYNNVNLSYIGKEGREIKTNRLGAKQIAEAYKDMGIEIRPNEVESQQVINHFFRIHRVTIQLGEREKRVWLPLEYVGTEYEAPVAEEVSFK